MHIERQRPCGQALHTLQCERYFTPCSHGPFVGGALFRFTPFFVSNSGTSTSPSASSMFGTSILTIGRRTVVITPARPTKCQRSHSFQISFISQPSQNEFAKAIFVNRKLDRNATVTGDGPRVLTRLDPAQHQRPIRRRLLAEFWVILAEREFADRPRGWMDVIWHTSDRTVAADTRVDSKVRPVAPSLTPPRLPRRVNPNQSPVPLTVPPPHRPGENPIPRINHPTRLSISPTPPVPTRRLSSHLDVRPGFTPPAPAHASRHRRSPRG